MKNIVVWLIVLGGIQIILFGLCLYLFLPKEVLKDVFHRIKLSAFNFKYLAIIIAVVIIHLIEVNLLDSYFTNLIGVDFAPTIQSIENGIVHWFSQNWTPVLVYFFVFMYIIMALHINYLHFYFAHKFE